LQILKNIPTQTQKTIYSEFKKVSMPNQISPPKTERLLSIIYAGRNDYFGGNFIWRMSTVLNKLAENIDTLDVSREVEIIVSDWGSDTPLYNDLELTETAKTIVKFIFIPASISAKYDQATGFSKVHAINSAARRSTGVYLLVCDYDVYIPLDTITKILRGLRRGYFQSYSLDDSFFWASKYVISNDYFSKAPERKTLPTLPIDSGLNISTDFISNFPVQEHLDDFIRSNWTSFVYESVSADKSYTGSGAALVMSKAMWFESTGFDERFIGTKWNDIDFTQRLLRKYRWDDLENHGLSFFLLGYWHDHYHLNEPSSCKTPLGTNIESIRFSLNPPDWGLAYLDLGFFDGYGISINPITGMCESENCSKFDTTKKPITVYQIIEQNPLYHNVSERFEYLPLTWFTNQDALNVLLKILKPESICEIGSWMGASARFFASFPFVFEVFCVDHWNRNRVEGYDPDGAPQQLLNNLYEQFLANAVHSCVGDKIIPLRLDSNNAAEYCNRHDIRFDLIYIDGDHTTVGARADILKWYPLLNEGGYICGDDWGWQKEPDNVAGAVISVAYEKGWQIFYYGNFWLLLPGTFSVQQLTLETLQRIIPITSNTFSRRS
jgi:hypothetical protein